MPETKPKDSYSFYLPVNDIKKIDDCENYSRSEAARAALSQWIPENIEN